MVYASLPTVLPSEGDVDRASLWDGGRQSLLGDRRALTRGDIMTVVIEIDDRAEISNSSGRSRAAGDEVSMPQMIGIPQRLADKLPEGASFDELREGQTVEYSEGQGPKGPRAENVKVI